MIGAAQHYKLICEGNMYMQLYSFVSVIVLIIERFWMLCCSDNLSYHVRDVNYFVSEIVILYWYMIQDYRRQNVSSLFHLHHQ